MYTGLEVSIKHILPQMDAKMNINIFDNKLQNFRLNIFYFTIQSTITLSKHLVQLTPEESNEME
jgi:hypothetical protein